MKRKKGQVWIETVIYTVIGISLLALVLSFITPKITQAREKVLIEQTVEAMQIFDGKINAAIESGPSNRRTIEFTVKQGVLAINTTNDQLLFAFDGLRHPYSEPGSKLAMGQVDLITLKMQNSYTTILTMKYPLNLTIQESEKKVPTIYPPSTTPYKFSIENINGSMINIVEFSR